MMHARELRVAARRLVSVSLLAGGLTAVPAANAGEVNLELRPVEAFGAAYHLIEVELYAVHADPGEQPVAALDVVLGWDAASLQLLGVDSTGAVPLLVSTFPSTDLFNVNESVPPQDGDGYYVAWALPSNSIPATPEGALITTFKFVVLPPNGTTTVSILPSAGDPPGQSTLVWDGTQVNTIITGGLGSTDLRVGCPADTDLNGVVDIDDLLDTVLDWGTNGFLHNADVTNDGIVDIDDLLAVILSWGPCP